MTKWPPELYLRDRLCRYATLFAKAAREGLHDACPHCLILVGAHPVTLSEKGKAHFDSHSKKREYPRALAIRAMSFSPIMCGAHVWSFVEGRPVDAELRLDAEQRLLWALRHLLCRMYGVPPPRYPKALGKEV